MKTQAEIQRAHDLLLGIILGDTPRLNPNQKSVEQLSKLASVLCWALSHEHNKAFGELLADLEAAAKAQGYSFSDWSN